MPTWAQYRDIARGRGALAYQLFIVESVAKAPPEKIQQILPFHLAYQKEMEAAGKLFLAGPVSDETGTAMSGGGLIIYRAEDIEEARAIAAKDPMHKQGGRSFTVRAWLVNEGSLNIQLRLSEQRGGFD
ncbi:YciI family protein [Hoeflea sp. AS16]|uniref:YciI family protein n=1 Tax=Hoeflea sp. AS16 TaxID=3135779 RepID=UPI00316B0BAB